MQEQLFSVEILLSYQMMPKAVSLSQQIAQVGQCAQHLKELLISRATTITNQKQSRHTSRPTRLHIRFFITD